MEVSHPKSPRPLASAGRRGLFAFSAGLCDFHGRDGLSDLGNLHPLTPSRLLGFEGQA